MADTPRQDLKDQKDFIDALWNEESDEIKTAVIAQTIEAVPMSSMFHALRELDSGNITHLLATLQKKSFYHGAAAALYAIQAVLTTDPPVKPPEQPTPAIALKLRKHSNAVNPNVDYNGMPNSMRALPRDERGYPIPWFVDYLEDGTPEFRAMDPEKFKRAVTESRCWVCGDKLGVNKVFVVGPMCGINRISSEPPSHKACALWSVKNCPFMVNPNMVRREDETINTGTCTRNSAGVMVTRNPGVTMLWVTRTFEIIPDGKNKGYLFHFGVPDEVLWYARKEKASYEDVRESLESGIGILKEVALKQGPDAAAELKRAVTMFHQYMPSAAVITTNTSLNGLLGSLGFAV